MLWRVGEDSAILFFSCSIVFCKICIYYVGGRVVGQYTYSKYFVYASLLHYCVTVTNVLSVCVKLIGSAILPRYFVSCLTVQRTI